jgi:hypothetical protein
MSPKPPRRLLPDLSADARAEAQDWLGAHRAEVPPSVADALSLSLELASLVTKNGQKSRSLLSELRRALGITPTSERRKASIPPLSGAPGGRRKRRALTKDELEREHEREQRLATWHRGLGRRHGRKAKDIEGRLMRVEDIELTPEEEAEIERENAEYMTRLALGDRCDLDCASSSEKLMAGAAVEIQEDEILCEVDRDALPRGCEIKQQFFEERERIGFSFTVTRHLIQVEKVSVASGGGVSLVAATVEDVGPPKSKVTWEFLSSMTILVAQYAMPLSRFAELASSPVKSFTAAETSRHFRYVAGRLCSVYLELGRSLAAADVLAGDDTTSRVVEVNKALAAKAAGAGDMLPWTAYATAEAARKVLESGEEATLALRTAAKLGFEADRKDGLGVKTGFNTTVLTGRSEAHDPRSTVVFFRSHFGGLGNLLTAILAGRPLDKPSVVIQSDLSTVNLISDVALRQRLQVTLPGCAAHARRPFALYENDDPDLCAHLLHCFQGLSIYEGGIDTFGRNRDNTAAVRGADSRLLWETIKELAVQVAGKWSRESKLGDGARYILKHYDRLTYYLGDHRVPPSNNFCERMLRPEKLIQNNALFRQTLEGRFALDIVRTVLQTAIAARVDLNAYLNWVLRMPGDVIDESPAEFTPLAFARLHHRPQ